MEGVSILDKLLGNKYIIVIVFCVLFANAVVIDILFFSSRKNTAQCFKDCPAQFSQIAPSPLPSPLISASVQQIITPASVPSSTPIPTATSTPIPTPTPELREYFIPLGQGSGAYADWTAIPGIGAKINLANYGKIEKAYFEATIRIPTGNQTVYIRLYNANSFQSIPNSDLTLSGGTSTMLTSQPITLTDGDNLYQVQLKTQLQYQTYVDQARIRIVSR